MVLVHGGRERWGFQILLCSYFSQYCDQCIWCASGRWPGVESAEDEFEVGKVAEGEVVEYKLQF